MPLCKAWGNTTSPAPRGLFSPARSAAGFRSRKTSACLPASARRRRVTTADDGLRRRSADAVLRRVTSSGWPPRSPPSTAELHRSPSQRSPVGPLDTTDVPDATGRSNSTCSDLFRRSPSSRDVIRSTATLADVLSTAQMQSELAVWTTTPSDEIPEAVFFRSSPFPLSSRSLSRSSSAAGQRGDESGLRFTIWSAAASADMGSRQSAGDLPAVIRRSVGRSGSSTRSGAIAGSRVSWLSRSDDAVEFGLTSGVFDDPPEVCRSSATGNESKTGSRTDCGT